MLQLGHKSLSLGSLLDLDPFVDPVKVREETSLGAPEVQDGVQGRATQGMLRGLRDDLFSV